MEGAIPPTDDLDEAEHTSPRGQAYSLVGRSTADGMAGDGSRTGLAEAVHASSACLWS